VVLLESVGDIAETHVQESDNGFEDMLVLDYGGNNKPQCFTSVDESSDGDMTMELHWMAGSASRIECELDIDEMDVLSELQMSGVIKSCPQELQVKSTTSTQEFESKELRPPGLHSSIVEEHGLSLGHIYFLSNTNIRK